MIDLKAEYDRLIDYWYEYDQHFDSEVLKRIMEIEKILKDYHNRLYKEPILKLENK